VTRLARVGIEHVQGYLDGGMYAWHQVGLPVATIAQIPVDELRHQLEEGQDVQVVDVRQPGDMPAATSPGPSASRSRTWQRGSRSCPRNAP
jgi:rhodanese-related sulfurtransferase